VGVGGGGGVSSAREGMKEWAVKHNESRWRELAGSRNE
jgi:hypothetical protein